MTVVTLSRNTQRVLSNIDPRHGSSAYDVAPLAGLTEPTILRHVETLHEHGLLAFYGSDQDGDPFAQLHHLSDEGFERQRQIIDAFGA